MLAEMAIEQRGDEFTGRLTRLASVIGRGVAILGLAASTYLPQRAPDVYAASNEFGFAGIVVCGVREGRRCPQSPDNTYGILTEDFSGNREVIPVDFSWVKRRDMPSLHEGDPLELEVMKVESGRLMVTRIVSEGDDVNRYNFGVREEYTQCPQRIGDDEKKARDGKKNCGDIR